MTGHTDAPDAGLPPGAGDSLFGGADSLFGADLGPARRPEAGRAGPRASHRATHPDAAWGLTAHERAVLAEWGWTYEVKDWSGPDGAVREIVSCRVCGHDSFHPDDLAEKYCSFCNAFHEARERLWAAETDAASAGDPSGTGPEEPVMTETTRDVETTRDLEGPRP